MKVLFAILVGLVAPLLAVLWVQARREGKRMFGGRR